MEKTTRQYHEVIATCRSLFLKKAADYGPSWTILRLPSVTDQILIKAERIRSLQETGINKVGEDEKGEFIAIVNYCAIALILFKNQDLARADLNLQMTDIDTLSKAYDANVQWAFETMERKNHDYGEAWRKMRISSITDLILMKINRLKQMEDNDGVVKVSEGVDANYIDMLNYAVFVLIKMAEAEAK
ncbi:MAG: DUF1599 domain-containing protein [Bacteroidota bacterium]